MRVNHVTSAFDFVSGPLFRDAGVTVCNVSHINLLVAYVIPFCN